jgi:hypothetical protein
MRTACFTIALAWTCSLSVPLVAQSLVDVARKEADRRKAAATGRVLTNDDVRSARPLTTAAATPGGEEAPGSASNADDAGRAEAPEAEAAEDRAKLREHLQLQISRDQLAIEALQSRLNGVAYQIEQVTDADMRALLERERSQASASLDSLRADIESKEQALRSFEPGAGVPPVTPPPGER